MHVIDVNHTDRKDQKCLPKHHYDGAWVHAELPAAVQENKPALSQAGCLRE